MINFSSLLRLLGSSSTFLYGNRPFHRSAFGVLLLSCLVAGSSYAATPTVKLSFYVVHAKAAEGLRRFDSGLYPNLGYISQRPELVVARLESVNLGTYRDRSKIEGQEAAAEDRAALVIGLTAGDAKALAAITSAHVGKRLLLMLGSQAIWAPYIDMKIDATSIQIVPRPGTDLEKVKRELESLVHGKK